MLSPREFDEQDPYILVRRVLEDGRVVRLHKMFGQNTRLTLAKNEDDQFFEQMYCYHDTVKAVAQARTWDGNGDPDGWYRHINTARRRPGGDPTKEYVEP